MRTKLYWVNGPWSGKLALSARPRGGEWLPDEIQHWRDSGIDTVFSLLTPEEEQDLDLASEAATVTSQGMNFFSLPIADRQIPTSRDELTKALEAIDSKLSAGRNIVLHCRQGIGRTGLVAACLLLTKGLDPASAIRQLSLARGVEVPETPEQRRWIDDYASAFVGAR